MEHSKSGIFSPLEFLIFTAVVVGVFLFPSIAPSEAAAQEKIVYSISNETGDDSTLFTINPDGSEQTELFSFRNHPRLPKGTITHPRLSDDGKQIYFNSDNAHVYTPARNNIFRVGSDGSGWEQITPGPVSGKWDQPCPCGSVTGSVKRSNGEPYGNSPVFLEGMGLVHSGADGSFRYDSVPEGLRWIVAYRPDDSTVFEAMTVLVTAGLNSDIALVPDSDLRMNFETPIAHGGRIHHVLWPGTLRWTDDEGAVFHDLYTAGGNCTGVPEVDGYDVAPSSGRLAVADYQEGCETNRGIYITGRDGNGPQLLVDMKADRQYCGVQELFWSKDESKIAVKICYNWATCLAVYDAGTGDLKGSACFDPGLSLYNVALHGFSPDGTRLLFSTWSGQTSNGELSLIGVNSDGSLDTTVGVTLLSGVNLSGATWGELSEPDPQSVPAAPVLSVDKNAQTVTVSWSSVAGADGYVLFAAPMDLSTLLEMPMGTETSISVRNWEEPAFYVAVRAKNPAGLSEYSNLGVVP